MMARPLVAALGLALALFFLSGLLAPELSPAGRAALATASLAVGLWGSELLPLPATAVLAMALLFVLGAVDLPQRALIGLSSPVLAFFLGSAALGVAAEHTGLADRLAGRLLRRAGGSGARLLGDFLLSLPVQALIVPSAMSRNAVLVPIYDRVLQRMGRPARLGAAMMLALGVLGPLSSGALLSGGVSPVAAAQAIGGFTWLSWLIALAPVYWVLLALDGAALWLMTRPFQPAAPEVAAPETSGRMSGPEWRVVAIIGATSLLWALDALTGWPPAIPALIALVAILAPPVGVMGWSAFAARAPWATCVVLAGAVSLAEALGQTGGASWLARGLFAVIPATGSAVTLALAVYVVTALIALAIPNRAAAITLCVPLAIAYVAGGALSAAAAGLIVMIAVDAETIYPAQTAANLMAYEKGYVRAGLLAKYNLVTLLLGAAVVVLLALPWWSLVGLPGG